MLKLPRLGNYILLAILLILDIGLSILFFYQFSSVDETKSANSFADAGTQILGAQSYLSGLLIAIFFIMNVGKEYKDGTLRKNIIDGFTRDDFYVGKAIIMILCVLFAFVMGLMSLLIGSLVLDHFQDFADMLNATFLINFFVELFYSALFASFLIFLFKKTTIAIVFFFVWGIVEGIIVGIQSAYMQIAGADPIIEFGHYLPDSSLQYVLKTTEIVEPRALIVTSFYIVLMYILPYYLFTKADIKS